jgi:hypothetical protein
VQKAERVTSKILTSGSNRLNRLDRGILKR